MPDEPVCTRLRVACVGGQAGAMGLPNTHVLLRRDGWEVNWERVQGAGGGFDVATPGRSGRQAITALVQSAQRLAVW